MINGQTDVKKVRQVRDESYPEPVDMVSLSIDIQIKTEMNGYSVIINEYEVFVATSAVDVSKIVKSALLAFEETRGA